MGVSLVERDEDGKGEIRGEKRQRMARFSYTSHGQGKCHRRNKIAARWQQLGTSIEGRDPTSRSHGNCIGLVTYIAKVAAGVTKSFRKNAAPWMLPGRLGALPSEDYSCHFCSTISC